MLWSSSALILDWIIFIIVGNEDNHKILNEFESPQGQTANRGVSCTQHLAKSHNYNGRKVVVTLDSVFIFYWIFFSL